VRPRLRGQAGGGGCGGGHSSGDRHIGGSSNARPTAVDLATVVEIPDDDALPPRWGQWVNWPAPAHEPAAGVLVMREDGCVMPRKPTHGAKASSSRAGIPAPDATVARLEQEREPASAAPAHFNEAQAEQALWQEFCVHDASINNALNEALRIHAGPAWQIFKVRVLIIEFEVFPCRFCTRAFPDFASSTPCLPLTGAGGPGSREVQLPRSVELRVQLLPRLVRRPRRSRRSPADRQRVAGVPAANCAG
jgi:hypothetical protein